MPVVLSQREVRLLLGALPQPARLCAALMYGGGLRVAECLSLRVKDMDLDRREILVRGGKGGKDRRTPLAESTVREVKQWLVAPTGKTGISKARTRLGASPLEALYRDVVAPVATEGTPMPIGSARFVREKAFDARAVLGLAIGGIPAVLIAALIVKSMPITYVRWMVVIVVIYTAVTMLRSAMTERSVSTKAAL